MAGTPLPLLQNGETGYMSITDMNLWKHSNALSNWQSYASAAEAIRQEVPAHPCSGFMWMTVKVGLSALGDIWQNQESPSL